MPFAWRRFTANWLTAALGVVQVGIAIGAVISLLSAVLPALGGSIPSFLELSYRPTATAPGGAAPAGARLFEPEDAALVRSEVAGVREAATLVVQPLVVIEVEGRRYLVRSVGATDPGYFRLVGLEAVTGQFFGPAEMATGTAVALVSEAVARQIFGSPDDALGREIVMLSVEEGLALQGRLSSPAAGMSYPPPAIFEVAGVFRRPAPAGAASTDVLQPEVVVPLGWLTQEAGDSAAVGAGPFRGRSADVLYIAASPDETDQVRRAAQVLLEPILEARRMERALGTDRSTNTWELQVVPGGLAGRVRERSEALSGVLGGLVLAALAAAALATASAGLVHIMENRRAIALSRSLGATRRRTMRQVLLESVSIAGLGGLLGLGLAWPMQRLLGPALALLPGPPSDPSIPRDAAVIGIGLALGVGLLAGWYPGWMATRWPPADVLRDD